MIYYNTTPIRAALFDLDDLLVDSTPSRMEFIFDTLEKLGAPCDRTRDCTFVLSKGDGPGTLGLWNFPATVLELTDDELAALGYPADLIAARDPTAFMAYGCDVLRQCMNAATDDGTVLIDGARELLAFCQENNVATGIISNAAEKNIGPLLERLGLAPLVDSVFGDDAARTDATGNVINKSSNPAATFAIVMAQLAELRPDLADIQLHEIIYAGDRPSDVKFAHAVGCIAVHVPSAILPTVGPWPAEIQKPQITAASLQALRQRLSTTPRRAPVAGIEGAFPAGF